VWRRAGAIGEFVDIEERCIGQGIVLEIAPPVFDRIEFRGIGRQEDGSDLGLSAQKGLDDAGTVRRSTPS
jgi:hypothetical protein